jgi:hypothetical protein
MPSNTDALSRQHQAFLPPSIGGTLSSLQISSVSCSKSDFPFELWLVLGSPEDDCRATPNEIGNQRPIASADGFTGFSAPVFPDANNEGLPICATGSDEESPHTKACSGLRGVVLELSGIGEMISASEGAIGGLTEENPRVRGSKTEGSTFKLLKHFEILSTIPLGTDIAKALGLSLQLGFELLALSMALCQAADCQVMTAKRAAKPSGPNAAPTHPQSSGRSGLAAARGKPSNG